jgi:hypothetical protein
MVMKILFDESNPNKVVELISKALGSRELGKMVEFSLKGADLCVVISKMGRSELLFASQENGEGLLFELTKEKIAFAHRPFKDEVMIKIKKVIETCGGQVHS